MYAPKIEQKTIIKMIKKDEKIMQEINTEIYLKKKKINRENMEGRNRYHNMSETMKLKLKEYKKLS